MRHERGIPIAGLGGRWGRYVGRSGRRGEGLVPVVGSNCAWQSGDRLDLPRRQIRVDASIERVFQHSRGSFNSGPVRITTVKLVAGLHPP